jgi:hypothetical protein
VVDPLAGRRGMPRGPIALIYLLSQIASWCVKLNPAPNRIKVASSPVVDENSGALIYFPCTPLSSYTIIC